LSLSLSQGLFSSFQVDPGSLFLLKTLAQRIDFQEIQEVLDWGCGVGTLGLSLKKRHPHLQMTMVDRDMLAVGISELNSQKNGVEVEVQGGLGHFGLEKQFDLVVCNWPAKAGEPVLREALASFGSILNAGGKVAMVVVRPLIESVKAILAQQNSQIQFYEENRSYGVFHFFPKNKPSFNPLCFIRNRISSPAPSPNKTIDTVYGLPSFNTLSIQEELALNSLDNLQGRVLFWEPGQGHLPLALAAQHPDSSILLGGRDLLALWISHRNLNGSQKVYGCSRFPDLVNLLEPHSLEAVVLPWNPLPGTKEEKAIFQGLNTLLAPRGYVLAFGSSTAIGRLLTQQEGWKVKKSEKTKGHRSVLLHRA